MTFLVSATVFVCLCVCVFVCVYMRVFVCVGTFLGVCMCEPVFNVCCVYNST